jgi:hypothetical protein
MPLSPAPMQPAWPANNTAQSVPGKIQAIAIIQTVAGGLEILMSIFWFFYVLVVGLATFGIGLILIPVPIIVLTVGILSLVSGIKGLNKKMSKKLAFTVAICQMVLLLGCDALSFGGGLAGVILLTQEDTKAYFRQLGQ